ncbi:mucin-like protein [Pecten maximus]|uniref:mucin-like protein n=1 Tax=Pecten maximus TaxID=6579 RepID=UPI0014590B8A|nr:mucin-like protein [Pecten maximus]
MEAEYFFILLSFVLHIVSCIPDSEFYPFGRAVLDHDFPKNDDGSSSRVNISTLFPFFNSQHDSLYVNTNGAISFQQTLNQFTPAPFPLNDHRSIVSPFWADVDIRNGGTVWYRETTAPDILQLATNEIRLYNPDQLYFHASWVFIPTWDNVAFYGASSVGRTKRNTFQAVLITNGLHSFTVFNYAKVTWTTGSASHGDLNTGLGGTPAQVGFNGGDGVNFYALPESRTPAIINLPRMSNVKTNGKFVFRIDTASIENGGCNTGDYRTSRNCQQADARQCYRLNNPGPNGSGRLCCYDYLGNLMDAKSVSGGGTAHRFHYFGGPGSVPYLSTLVFDTSPYFHCCKYIRDTAGLALCARLLQQRPQGDCKNYQPIRPARLNGDSHFTTLDGLSYTFNGVGEFILLKRISDAFSAQVRMEQVAGPDGSLRQASVITSFSAKRFSMPNTVEVRLNSIRVADVLVNGEIVDFINYRSLHFNGVSTRMTERNNTDGSLKQITVIFTEPILAFRILAYRSFLNVIIVSGSDSLRGRVRRHNSLFTYPIGKSYSTFQNVAFTPLFQTPVQTIAPEARNICGHDEFCLYDYHATGRADIAGATRAASQTFKSIQLQAKPVIVCDRPLDVAYGYWNSTGLVVNSTAVLICEEGRRPNTSDVISCTADGTWRHISVECIEIRCEALPHIPSGQWLASNYTMGAIATLQCDVGSNLNGSGVTTCDEVGMWNPNGQTCVKVDCGPLPSFQNGRWVSNGTTFGHTAILECDEGTESVGSTNVHCGVTGTWGIGTQTCTTINCGPPNHVVNGLWTGGDYIYGSLYHLICKTGTILIGNETVNCTAHGEWSSTGQRCVDVDCGDLPPVTYGQWISNGTTFGHIAFLQCEEGRQPSGPGNVSCVHVGNWGVNNQTCERVSSRSVRVGGIIGGVIGGITAAISVTCVVVIIVVTKNRRRKRKASATFSYVLECDKQMKANTVTQLHCQRITEN